MAFYRTDGRSIKSLSVNDVFGAGFDTVLGQQDIAPRAYYAIVPFVRRAVRLRANAVAGVPVTLQRGSKDVSNRPEFAGLMDHLSQLIWKTEFALCLSQYGAYWRRTENAIGLNPTPEWLLPHACWPFITTERGLDYIRYIHPWGVPGAGTVEHLPLEEVVYFWHPSLDRANWPGSSPGLTASAAASALHNRDAFVSTYFQRGAIKGVLLSVPPNTQEVEKNKLRDRWRQIMTGIVNAWKTIVISTDVKPVIIGDGLKDIENEQLTKQYRQDVAASFEVPESMLLSNSANFATAREERIGFYEETVFPALDMILTAANQQWLCEAYDAELVAHPEQTEARQDAQVQQAAAITDLVGQPVLEVNEGRAWLGLEPLEEKPTQPPPMVTEEVDYQTMEEEAQADDAAAEQEAQQTAKALGSDSLVPMAEMARMSERGTLREAHRAMRQATRDRHQNERALIRDQHITERRSARSARERLRSVHRQRIELTTLDQRHTAERALMRSLHAAERKRLMDRHTTERQRSTTPTQNGHHVEVFT